MQGWVVTVWNLASRLEVKLKEAEGKIKENKHEREEGAKMFEIEQHKLVAKN